MNQQELDKILELHNKSLNNEEGGVRANLVRANPRGAYLRGANLKSIKDDFFSKLNLAKDEVPALYQLFLEGKINGSVYAGGCACFVGSVAKIRDEKPTELTNGLKPDAASPTERWILAINEGDTPSNNPVSKITVGWIEEWAKTNDVKL